MATAQVPLSRLRRLRAPMSWRDLVLAVPLGTIGLLGTRPAGDGQGAWSEVPDARAHVLVAIAALALLLWRRSPILGLVICGLAVSGYLALGYPFGPVLLTGPAAAYAVATGLPSRPAAVWCAGFVVLTTAAAGPHFLGRGDPGWLGYLAWAGLWAVVVAAPASLGAAVLVRRRSEAGVRAEQARRAVSEERLAMAQDVHDGVGHGLAVIAMHAGVALHVLDRDPVRARELLTSIRDTSRESLDGLRADLAPLRTGAAAGARAVAARRPTPGLEDLPVLLDRMRDGGLELHEEVDQLVAVPADVATAAYRIVQESLTNVLRHAGDTSAWVRLHREGGSVVVEVRDRGRATGAPRRAPAGTGIDGMHRRAVDVGGHLVAGPVPEGGFLVRATLPLAVAAPADVATP